MFIHKNQLEHLLTPAHYISPEQHQLEVERIFLPGWHCVATRADLPRHGDFLTLDLFGQPLQIRNIDGEIHAFLNVCAHRHCLLTHLPRGNDPRFRCQYHGWEYTKDGCTGRIPDAGAFRPFDRENARLKKFRTATAGELVFVSLADDGPSLAEYLGRYYEFFLEFGDGSYRQAWKWDATYDANWKIPLENSLESYHVPCLHSKTFGGLPREENCAHELDERFTTFRFRDPSWQNRLQAWWVRRLGLPADLDYMHHHLHPNVTFVKLAVLRMVHVIWPTSPTSCRHLAWTFTARGHRPGLVRRISAAVLSPITVFFARQVTLEDRGIFADVQKGLEASVHRGVIGTREERIFLFQKYVLDKCFGT